MRRLCWVSWKPRSFILSVFSSIQNYACSPGSGRFHSGLNLSNPLPSSHRCSQAQARLSSHSETRITGLIFSAFKNKFHPLLACRQLSGSRWKQTSRNRSPRFVSSPQTYPGLWCWTTYARPRSQTLLASYSDHFSKKNSFVFEMHIMACMLSFPALEEHSKLSFLRFGLELLAQPTPVGLLHQIK